MSDSVSTSREPSGEVTHIEIVGGFLLLHLKQGPHTVWVKGSSIVAVYPKAGFGSMIATTFDCNYESVNESPEAIIAAITKSYKQVTR